MTLSEKTAYLRGLVDGSELDESKKEVKILNNILEILEDMAMSIEDLEVVTDDLQEQVDTLDEDLADVEDELYGEDDCDCDCCDDECDCDDCCEYFVTCPTCGDEIYLDEEIIADGEIECPGCGETLEFDLDACDDDCCWGCHADEE